MGKYGTVKVTLKNSGFAQLRTSPEVIADLHSRAVRVQAAAGGSEAGYEIDQGVGKGPTRRARASVRTASHRAVVDEATNRTLSRAFNAGKG